MNKEPLKGKMHSLSELNDKCTIKEGWNPFGWFHQEDIESAVEWLKDRWLNQCIAMFGKDWEESKDFKIFYNDFIGDIDQTFPDLQNVTKQSK